MLKTQKDAINYLKLLMRFKHQDLNLILDLLIHLTLVGVLSIEAKENKDLILKVNSHRLSDKKLKVKMEMIN